MNKKESYLWAANRVRAQVKRHVDTVATLANTCAILKAYLDFFWVGFYFLRHESLILGPFQGSPACVRLTLDKGVCAAAVRERKTILVPNVHEFPGHVACDERSQAEIVVPVFDRDENIRAVLDIDSDHPGCFDEQDQAGLEAIASLLQEIWTAAE